MNWWLAATIAAYVLVPVAVWGWAGGYIANKDGPISPFTYGTLSADFDFEARSDRLRVWRLRAAAWGLAFGSLAALVTWLVR